MINKLSQAMPHDLDKTASDKTSAIHLDMCFVEEPDGWRIEHLEP